MYLIILFILGIYFYGTRTFTYWKRKGIKHDYPLPFFGTNAKQFFQKATLAMVASETYRRYPNERVVGFYDGTRPAIIVRDPDIVKRILVTDFQNFYARGYNFSYSEIEDALVKNFFMVDGDLWRLLRQKFSPSFSTGRLKAMFPLITERTVKLQALAEEASKRDVFDVRKLMARFTLEVIGACGFGLDMDCINNESSQYRWLSKRIIERNLRDAFAFLAKVLFPENISKNITLFDPKIAKSLTFLVMSIMKEREFKHSGRNDFIDILLELKGKGGRMVGTSIEKKGTDGSPAIIDIEMDDAVMVAQVFLFYTAGFETSSSTASYTLHQFAYNPEHQKKAQKEIDHVLAKYNNKICYEAVNEMKYLQMAFSEAMRMYPSIGHLVRICTSPAYTIPEINLTINKGVKVIIPNQALQNDSQYFESPDDFNPERFNPEKNEIPKFVYLPFGEGPRACAGAKLGQMQAVTGLAAVLHKYSVEPAACSVRNPPPDPTGFVSENFIGGLPLKLRKRH